MSEQRKIPTRTRLNVDESTSRISIRTEYEDVLDKCIFIQAFIAEVNTISNGISVPQGYLAVEFDNSHPDKPIISINSNGELVITAQNADKYSINENGELELICN